MKVQYVGDAESPKVIELESHDQFLAGGEAHETSEKICIGLATYHASRWKPKDKDAEKVFADAEAKRKADAEKKRTADAAAKKKATRK